MKSSPRTTLAPPPSPRIRRLIERSVACEREGDLDGAVDVAGEAATLAPTSVDAMLRLGAALRAAGKLDVARDAVSHALALGPGRVDVMLTLAMTCRDLGESAEARRLYEAVLAVMPRLPVALVNFGELCLAEGQCVEAVELLRRAIGEQPDSVAAWINLGAVLAQLGDHETAIACYDRALAIEPSHEVARLNRGTLLLVTGEWARGWADYESRFTPSITQPRRQAPGPRWQGEPLAGRTLLVTSEQGLGDHLQFVRYAKPLADAGARVIVECPAAVESLLAAAPGVAGTIVRDAPFPAYDYHVPLLSIPLVLGTTEATIPGGVPYLAPPAREPAHAAEIAARIDPPDALRVGVVWAGSPTHKNDRRRSVGVGVLRYLLDVPGTRLVALQKGPGIEQLQLLAPPLRERLAEVGPLCDDFADTAWAIERLDLVLTVDTSVAHLAGAMGKPVWMIIPVDPDWRWLREREDSPWYPTMRIFRQPTHGDWGSVILRVREELERAASRFD